MTLDHKTSAWTSSNELRIKNKEIILSGTFLPIILVTVVFLLIVINCWAETHRHVDVYIFFEMKKERWLKWKHCSQKVFFFWNRVDYSPSLTAALTEIKSQFTIFKSSPKIVVQTLISMSIDCEKQVSEWDRATRVNWSLDVHQTAPHRSWTNCMSATWLLATSHLRPFTSLAPLSTLSRIVSNQSSPWGECEWERETGGEGKRRRGTRERES